VKPGDLVMLKDSVRYLPSTLVLYEPHVTRNVLVPTDVPFGVHDVGLYLQTGVWAGRVYVKLLTHRSIGWIHEMWMIEVLNEGDLK